VVITNHVWVVVAELKFSGLIMNRGNLGIVEEFNKMQFTKVVSRIPSPK